MFLELCLDKPRPCLWWLEHQTLECRISNGAWWQPLKRGLLNPVLRGPESSQGFCPTRQTTAFPKETKRESGWGRRTGWVTDLVAQV